MARDRLYLVCATCRTDGAPDGDCAVKLANLFGRTEGPGASAWTRVIDADGLDAFLDAHYTCFLGDSGTFVTETERSRQPAQRRKT